MKIGDKVQFLSDIGGGKIAGFQGKDIALVEDENGFQIPTPISDLVVMSSELYDKFARINRIDQAIFESEQEIANGAEAVDAEIVFAELEKKH